MFFTFPIAESASVELAGDVLSVWQQPTDLFKRLGRHFFSTDKGFGKVRTGPVSLMVKIFNGLLPCIESINREKAIGVYLNQEAA